MAAQSEENYTKPQDRSWSLKSKLYTLWHGLYTQKQWKAYKSF